MAKAMEGPDCVHHQSRKGNPRQITRADSAASAFKAALDVMNRAVYLAEATVSTVMISPFRVPLTVTFCAAYLSSSGSWPSSV